MQSRRQAGVGFTLRRNTRLIIIPRSFTPPSSAGKRPGQMSVQQIKRGELYQSERVAANDIWEQHGKQQMTHSKGWRHPPAVMARKRKPA